MLEIALCNCQEHILQDVSTFFVLGLAEVLLNGQWDVFLLKKLKCGADDAD